MKKILFLLTLVALSFSAQSQTITDTATLRANINANIIPNAVGSITAAKLNTILLGNITAFSKIGVTSITRHVGTDSCFYVKNGIETFAFLVSTSASGVVSNSGASNRLTYYSASGTTVGPLAAITGDRLLISNASGLPTQSSATATEASYLSGVTSAIQTQFTGKQKTIVVGLPLTKAVGSVSDTLQLSAGDVNNDGYITATAYDSFYNKRFSPYGNTFASGWFLGSNNNFPLPFKINGVEKMRLWSGGLSIGNTNTTHALDVTGVINGTSDALFNGIAVGQGAGGSQSTVLGFEAGLSNTGIENTLIGYQAGKTNGGLLMVNVGYLNGFNNTGSNGGSVGIGASGFANRTGGLYNIAIGYNTMTGGGSGGNNVAIGKASQNGNGSFVNNSSVGTSALNANTGNNNSAFGLNSLYTNTSGGSNLALGHYAGAYNTTEDHKLYISVDDLGTKAKDSSRALMYGQFDSSLATQRLKINGTLDATNIRIPTAGGKLLVATGSNASIGTATFTGLSSTITVNTTAVTSSSMIFVSYSGTLVSAGILTVTNIVNGTSFDIVSTSGTDASTVNWWIIN